jgi:hypothetical protein
MNLSVGQIWEAKSNFLPQPTRTTNLVYWIFSLTVVNVLQIGVLFHIDTDAPGVEQHHQYRYILKEWEENKHGADEAKPLPDYRFYDQIQLT